MLIIEIVLTIIAWGRGWKWLALAPIAFAVVVGLIVGSNNPGASQQDLIGKVVWADIVAIIALILMAIFGPQSVKPSGSLES